MNHEQKLKLARKYFVQQKLEEIGKFILLVIAFILAGIGLYYLILLLGHINCEKIMQVDTCTEENYMVNGTLCLFAFIFVFLLVGFLLWFFYTEIKAWLESNWERAKKRAGL